MHLNSNNILKQNVLHNLKEELLEIKRINH